MSWKTRIKRVNKAAAKQIAKEYQAYHSPPPSCHYCASPRAARLADLELCRAHFDYLRYALGAVERFDQDEESEVA